MDSDKKEKAIKALRDSYSTEEGEYGIKLFIQHHLEELSKPEWNDAIGIEQPSEKQVLESLILKSCWDDELVYDFTLPNEVTDYVVSVRFDDEGEIEEISMES